jgi:tetratricopeptide (TPR) repeat protein
VVVCARTEFYVKTIGILLIGLLAISCGSKRIAPAGRETSAAAPAAKPLAAGQTMSLEEFIVRVREASIAARPKSSSPDTLETSDPGLSGALALAVATPAPATYRAVALEYRRLRVFDRAHDYLDKALALDPADSVTYDVRARLWRDSGFPGLALPEAYRAVHYAPNSAIARNTLGTVLQSLGQRSLAREEYRRALALDPSAAFALNNLCYVLTLEGRLQQAVAACRRALDVQPGLTAARNNLGLAYAAQGRTGDARSAFAAGGDRAVALYNTGIALMARREYGSAVAAFQAAHAARPAFRAALARADQARAAQARGSE